ncbi:hydroxymethylbilane synthase [Paenibacillus polymyxa]|jgi:hydroxymethylbilane synthase|uniref:hydroxymethylbilane synthase n=1 Tax=Paenibacillus TaxID=44249 RepID=UPI000D31D216|nr:MULTISPECIES: hydroxymethylbilane synthase [Paenibacillus]KAE8560980.1 hydroxymethylbilane synthase [Paenibacillus polymyxa]KAF6617887.1 hydroxymethylbilane synthase [Paenibacillus sp. EKM101P]KAF6618696.1 hydroxymethylbilane synthase [Paenibacillus sp. EKM102P]KAF6626818.1 hydroxymethylbilane synthase [Paenibacillus sp. EKM10P]KAF6646443.1 hydroxymethylbilane synthase [Paenibacillus sp. EKM11P]
MRTIVVGSRQSALALTQTGHVIEDLNALCAEHGLDLQFVVKKILTKGDRILDVTLSKVGGKGLFVKEIEQAMLAGEIDMAVHSMKDMPSELPEGLVNGAVPRREDPRDCLITLGAKSLEDLPPGAKVGTSSLRRASQIKSMRPDLQLEPVRGNIDSRLKKLETEGFDAIILAAAGLHRMGWKDRITSYIPEEACLPAVGQGALGIECRASDEELLALLKLYNHQDTSATVAAERTFLGVLNGGCQVPIGAHAVWAGQEISLTGMVGSPDGEVILKETLQGNDPQKLGEAVAASLIAKGAEQILAQVRG